MIVSGSLNVSEHDCFTEKWDEQLFMCVDNGGDREQN